MRKSWDEHELAILRERYLCTPRQELESLLPSRSWAAIEQRANHLGIRRECEREYWTPEQIEILKVEYPYGARIDELSAKLRKSPIAVKNAAARLQLERIVRQASESPFRLKEGEQLLAHLPEVDKGYIAGLFDGEGWVSFSYLKPRPERPKGAYLLTVGIVNTDPRVIEWLCSRVYAKLLHVKASSPNRQDSYQWRLGLYRGVQFCREIAPYLIVKREEAELVAEVLKNGFSHLSTQQREDLREALQVRKTKGYRGNGRVL